MPTQTSLEALQVVGMAAYGATSNDKVDITATIRFQCSKTDVHFENKFKLTHLLTSFEQDCDLTINFTVECNYTF